MEATCPNCKNGFEWDGVAQRVRCKSCSAWLSASEDGFTDKTLADWSGLLNTLCGPGAFSRGMRWALLLTLLGLMLFVCVEKAKSVRESYATNAWSTTTGTIKSAKASESFDEFIPTVTYSYEVNGEEYLGTNVSLHRGGEQTFEKAADALAVYRINQAVPVYYDPQKPGWAVLIKGVQFGSLEGIGIGVAVAVACVLGMYLMYITRSPEALAAGIAPARRILDRLG